MTGAGRDDAGWLIQGRTWWLDQEIVEYSLLLSGHQAANLERLAHSRHLTVGQLVRILIREFLASESGFEPSRKGPAEPPSMPISEDLTLEKGEWHSLG
jgi:hypothetical protein